MEAMSIAGFRPRASLVLILVMLIGNGSLDFCMLMVHPTV